MSSFVQQVETDASASSTTITSPTFGSNRTAGNMLWFVIGYTNATAEQTATYSGCLTGAVETGHTYNATDDFGMRWGYLKNISGGSTSAGTATFSAACTFRSIYIREDSGLDQSAPASGTSVVQRQSNPGAGTDAISSGNLTPGAQPGTLFGFALDFSVSAPPTAGTGFNSRTGVWDYGAADPSTRPEDKAITSTSGVPATATAFTGRGGDIYYTIADYYIDQVVAGGLKPWVRNAGGGVQELNGLFP